MIQAYYMLTKPGIIMGNIITTIAGFLLASRGQINWALFCATFFGLSFIIGSACVFNNFIDRKADKKMERTKNRALATGDIASWKALAFGSLLAFLGTAILSVFVNVLATALALVGFLVYVTLYSFYKYRSSNGTLIGSIAGAMPPIVGYCAASNHFDLEAAFLFFILVFWQMPHFYSIAIYRLQDYAVAGIPVLPIQKGLHSTKVQMLVYIVLFMIACFMLTFLHYTGYVYLVVAAIVSIIWLLLCLKGFKTTNDALWARKMFRFSLVVVMALCAVLSIPNS